MPLPPSGNLVTPLGRLADDTVQELQLDNSLNLKVTDASRLPARGAGKADNKTDSSGTAGNVALYLDAIPANKIYRLGYFNFSYFGNVTGVTADVYIKIAGTQVQVVHLSSIISGYANYQFTNLVMNAGDQLWVVFWACVAGNSLQAAAIYEDLT